MSMNTETRLRRDLDAQYEIAEEAARNGETGEVKKAIAEIFRLARRINDGELDVRNRVGIIHKIQNGQAARNVEKFLRLAQEKAEARDVDGTERILKRVIFWAIKSGVKAYDEVAQIREYSKRSTRQEDDRLGSNCLNIPVGVAVEKEAPVEVFAGV